MKGTNWIHANGFTNETASSLYVICIYFTITTIATVGYGDISATNDMERVICCLLMVVGVSFFSIASGIFTNIIQNADIENHKIAEKKAILDKILADY